MRNPPPLDAELVPALAALTQLIPATITPDMIAGLRAPGDPSALTAGRSISHREVTIVGYEGAEIVVSVFAKKDHVPGGPGLFHLHPGGMVIGTRFDGMPDVLDWVDEFDAVCVSVEYRLAPEFPDPYPIEDSFAALTWMAQNAAELGFDPSRLVLVGGSAGGGLAAGLTLLARERGGPGLFGALLMYPMLDDRNDSVSARQIDGVGFWDRTSNETAWNAILGTRRGTDDVSVFVAPARAQDLSGLPQLFIDVASVEVFRDEAVAFATRVWADGGVAELHVVPGGFHGFENVAPDSAIAKQVRAARRAWLARILEAGR